MRMDDAALIAAIEQHESQTSAHGQLAEDRIEAEDRYLGRPFGNEVEGRSQVVSRQAWDTVEWLKPQLADIFCSGEEVVAFKPRGPEDVQAAEQETDYIGHIVTQRNNWFEIWYGWTHDAMVKRNGYVKAYWDDSEDNTVEKYSRLTQEEYAALSQDASIEIVEQFMELDETGAVFYTCEVERKKPRNVVKIDNLPPESVRVSKHARGLSLQDPRVPFVEHAEFKTISELRAEGFTVPDDISDSGGEIEYGERANRRVDQYDDALSDEESDPSMRQVWTRECWIRVDRNGDGRAELLHVVVVGTTPLLIEDAPCVPIVALCPIPQPHTHDGLSVVDAVLDLEMIQTALLRGALDNQYLSNNGRYAISDDVNLDDMLDSRPGGVVRVLNGKQPTNEILPLTHSTTGNGAVPMMEYMDRIAQKRTGVNEQTQGIDPNSLNKTATASAMLNTASQQRIKFIARIFAETGVKALFQLVHELTLQNSRQAEVVELRGKWVPVDPRTWVKRTDMVISVALGAGDRTQQLAFLSQMWQMQMQLMALGIVQPQQVYNTMSRMTKAAGYKDAGEFWTDPQGAPPPPPPQDPKLQIEQMRLQADAQKFQAQTKNEQERIMLEAQAKQRETQLQLELQASNDARDAERQREQAQMQYTLEQAKLQADAEQRERDRVLQEQIEAAKLALEKYKVDLQAQASMQQAEMSRQTTLETSQLSASTAIAAADKKEAAKAPAKPEKKDDSLAKAVAALAEQVKGIAAHQIAPRKKVRGADGKLTGVEVNGVVIPITE